jgi:segregation and condensation protein B
VTRKTRERSDPAVPTVSPLPSGDDGMGSPEPARETPSDTSVESPHADDPSAATPTDDGGMDGDTLDDAAPIETAAPIDGAPPLETAAPIDAEDAAAGVEGARELSRAHLRGLLEALVFASDKPVKSGELARLASAPVKHVRELLAELKGTYADRGVVLDEVAGGWLFRTSVQYAPFVREMSNEKPVRLSRAQVETLAIAAYRQPITRPEVDDIRGVDSGATLKLLLERDLVRILGKKDEPGRPLLYGTTTQFLEFFGLKSLKDLPTLKEFTELSEESRRTAEAELGDVLPEGATPGEAPGAPQKAVAPPPDPDVPPPPATPAHDCPGDGEEGTPAP